MALPDPPMAALFAAAARDLKSGHAGAALQTVLRARARTDAGVFRIIINDPIFTSIRARPELAAPAHPLLSTPAPSVPPTPAPPAVTP